jgi:acetylornithine deacetylase/succinyl-diaminopimelate desuccinylase-like protein
MAMEAAAVTAAVERRWEESVLPALADYVRIPNVSPAYAPDWESAGHMAAAARLLRDWCQSRRVAGAAVELVQLPALTPVLLVDIPASDPEAAAAGTVLLYGHLDKQPEMAGWREGLGPWTPVVEGDRLYGRGSADDGYSTFAALTAVEAVREAGGRHARCLVLIEASEESGSTDLDAYIEHLSARIGSPVLVIALDAGCSDYDRLWLTTSLRGLVQVVLRVSLLEVGIHSGASGAVASTFRILRQLLERIEDASSGRMLLPELHDDIPARRVEQVRELCELLGAEAVRYPLLPGARPVSEDPVELLLNSTWRPALSVVGFEGAPPVGAAGNVLRPYTTLKLSVRLPPTVPAAAAARALQQALESDPPYGATVEAVIESADGGWNAPDEPPWLMAALEEASLAAFGRGVRREGTGGSIPFVGSLAERFPEAAFMVTGVLGPGANAHGPNEFLHLPTARRVTECVAHVLSAHAQAGPAGR